MAVLDPIEDVKKIEAISKLCSCGSNRYENPMAHKKACFYRRFIMLERRVYALPDNIELIFDDE